MNKIPIGNTLQVRWRVKHNGQAESLEGLDLSLVMTTPSGQKQAMAFAVSDTNLVTVNYEGKDQQHTGNYRLDLYENRGVNNQRRIDSTPAFVLVAHTAEAHRESDPNLEVYTVDLTGDIEIGYPSNAVLYTPQELTAGQQAQARANINAKKGGYTRIEKLHDYIHEIWYDAADYSFADLLPHTPLGACTSIRKGKYFARNLDWQYSECCEFFVHTPAADGRHAVDGFGGNIPALTKSVVESGEWNAAYNWLPLSIADGHNDTGLCASMNVVPTKTAPNTYEKTTGTNPPKPTLNGLMIVRYILDNHTDALAAAEDIRDNWNVVMPHTETFDEELHFLIADKTKTIVLEFVGNEAVIISKPDQEGYITNFRLNGVNEESTATMIRTVEQFGQGVERYNLIKANIQASEDLNDAISSLSALHYTHAYDDDGRYGWLTEFAGLHDELTVFAAYSNPLIYAQTLSAAHQAYLDRTRDGQTWQTTHSVVYDIESGECLFRTQQDESTTTRRDMALPIDAYTKAETDSLLEDKVDKVSGKGLSTNDYTAADKAIVSGVPSALAGKLSKEIHITNGKIVFSEESDGLYILTELNGNLETYIWIKTDGLFVNGRKVATASDLAAKQDTISDLASIRSGASAGATAVQPGDLPTFGNIVTHDADEFATAEQGEKAATAVQYIPQQLTEAQKEQARDNIADTTRRAFGRNMYPEEFVYRDGSHLLNVDGTWKSGASVFIFKITKKHDRVRETYGRAFICEGWNETGLVNPVAFSKNKELTQEDVGKYIAVCHTSGYNGPMFSVYGENVWFEDDLTDKEIQAELDVIHSLYRPNEYKFNALTSETTTMYISPLKDCNGNAIRHVMGGCDDELGNQAWRYMVNRNNMQYANHCNLLLRHYVQRYNTSGVTSMYCAFSSCSYLESADLQYLDMSSVTSCEFMFSGCSSLTTLDVSGWNVGAVTSMQRMFFGCTSLATLIGGSQDLAKVAFSGLNFALILNQTQLDRASLRAVINGLSDRTGQAQLTLTLGNTLKAKLTDEDILVATNKNWRIA